MAQILPLKNKRVTLSLSQKERKQLALSVQKARNPLVMKALTPTYQVKGLNGINLFFWPHNCFNNLQYKYREITYAISCIFECYCEFIFSDSDEDSHKLAKKVKKLKAKNKKLQKKVKSLKKKLKEKKSEKKDEKQVKR